MAIPPSAHEAFAMQSQKAGIAEEFDAGVLQRIVERLVERFARGELLMIDGPAPGMIVPRRAAKPCALGTFEKSRATILAG